MNNERKNTQQK